MTLRIIKDIRGTWYLVLGTWFWVLGRRDNSYPGPRTQHQKITSKTPPAPVFPPEVSEPEDKG
jgi:hypothetical protein